MDVKEKLVELANDVLRYLPWGEIQKDTAEQIADRMMDHGVTVQAWISVKDRLPEHGDVVLCFMKFGEHRILQWDEVSSWWLGYGYGDDWQKADVAHWRYLPQAQKGE